MTDMEEFKKEVEQVIDSEIIRDIEKHYLNLSEEHHNILKEMKLI